MANESCTDCRWLSEPTEGHKWHACEFKLVLPRSMCGGPPRGAVNINDPFIGCPTWEKRAPTREEQIEAAAQILVDHCKCTGNVPGWAVTKVRDALAIPKPKPFELGILREPAQPTEAEMRRAVMEAGWEVGTCCWWAPGNSAAARTLTEAYARVMREKGGPRANS